VHTVDTAALVALAQTVEPNTTERTLEFWRSQGLLPHAERTGQDGVRPVWTYPAEASDQLQALLRLRSLSKDPHLLRVALWFDGYSVPTGQVRSSMIDQLRRLQEDLNKELAKRSSTTEQDTGTARWEAIEEIARTYARRRKGTTRFGRQRLHEREQAFAVLFGLGMGEPAAVEALDTTAEAAERALGLDQARRYRPNGVGPWLTGPAADGMALFAQVGSLPRLIETLEETDDAELDTARPVAFTLLTGLAAFSQMADAFAGYRNAAGIAGLDILADNLLVRTLLPAMVVALIRSPAIAKNLAMVHSALADTILPAHNDLHRLATLPPDKLAERLPNLDKMSWSQQNQVRRLIDSARVNHDTSNDETTR
jgi:hypothetical protein